MAPRDRFDPEQVKRVLGEDSISTVDALEKKANALAEMEARLQSDREAAEKKIEEERRAVETLCMELHEQHDKKLEEEQKSKRHRGQAPEEENKDDPMGTAEEKRKEEEEKPSS